MKTYRATVVRSLAFVAATALLAAAAATPTGAAIGQRDEITFRRAVALPGVVLPAGPYIFEVANPDSSLTVVRVAHRDTHKVYFAAFTMSVQRPASLPASQVVTLGEAPAGNAVPITAWYPRESRSGHRFAW
jgi:hypothetical protein